MRCPSRNRSAASKASRPETLSPSCCARSSAEPSSRHRGACSAGGTRKATWAAHIWMGVSSYTSTEKSSGTPARNGWPSHKALAASRQSASTKVVAGNRQGCTRAADTGVIACQRPTIGKDQPDPAHPVTPRLHHGVVLLLGSSGRAVHLALIDQQVLGHGSFSESGFNCTAAAGCRPDRHSTLITAAATVPSPARIGNVR